MKPLILRGLYPMGDEIAEKNVDPSPNILLLELLKSYNSGVFISSLKEKTIQ